MFLNIRSPDKQQLFRLRKCSSDQPAGINTARKIPRIPSHLIKSGLFHLAEKSRYISPENIVNLQGDESAASVQEFPDPEPEMRNGVEWVRIVLLQRKLLRHRPRSRRGRRRLFMREDDANAAGPAGGTR